MILLPSPHSWEEQAYAQVGEQQAGTIWLQGDALTVEYEETPLAQYTVRYQPDKEHFKEVPDTRRFETPYRSPQGWLGGLDETMWELARRLPDSAPGKRRKKEHRSPTATARGLSTTQV